MSTTFIGPLSEDGKTAFLAETVQTPTQGLVTVRTAVVRVEDLELLVEHFTEDDRARGALTPDDAQMLAERLEGYAASSFTDEVAE